MKIQSTSPDIASEPFHPDDITSNTPPSAEWFLNLLLQTMCTPPIENIPLLDTNLTSDIPVTPEEQSQFIDSDVPTALPDATQQMLLLQNLSDSEKAVIKDGSKLTMDAASNQNKLDSFINTLNTKEVIFKQENPLAIKEQEKSVSQPLVASSKISLTNPSAEGTFASTKPDLMTISSDLITPLIANELSSKNNVGKKDLNKEIIESKLTMKDLSFTPPNIPHKVNELSTSGFEKSEDHSFLRDSAFSESIATMTVPSKPLDGTLTTPIPHHQVFTELSQFINGKTSQINNPNGLATGSASSLPPHTFNHTQKMPEEVHIDLTPKLLNSIANEAYTAKIKIHPPELGSVTATLHIDKNTANLLLLTENTQVKHIVESNLSALRQHFQNADIQITDIQVRSDQKTYDQGYNESSRQNKESFLPENSAQERSTEEFKKDTNSDAIIDTYI